MMSSDCEDDMPTRSSLRSEVDASVCSESISDDEELYRSIDYISRQDCKYDDEGGFVISSQAFRDRNMRPSVDRALLRGNNPASSKIKPSDGVVSLVANEVRAQPIEHQNLKHLVDVEYKPGVDNQAHSQIFGKPDFPSQRPFEKLKTRLAILAKWQIHPSLKVDDPLKNS